jgi:hypothetical protein
MVSIPRGSLLALSTLVAGAPFHGIHGIHGITTPIRHDGGGR